VTLPTDTTIRELADFISGRERLGDDAFHTWHAQQRAELAVRLVTDSDSIHLVDDDREVKVFFAIPIVDAPAAGEDQCSDWHAQAMERVRLLRKVYPHREVYGSQGIGLEAFAELLPNDPTFKQIPAQNLPLERAVWLNAVFGSLVSYRHRRPETWKSYAEAALAFREAVSDCFRKLQRGWARLLEEAAPRAQTVKNLPGEELQRINVLSKLPMFPRTAVDEWGFVTEERNESLSGSDSNARLEGALRRFERWRKAFHDFESGVNHVCSRIVPQTVVYLAECRGHTPNETEDKDARLLLMNLGAAWEALRPMQREFRRRFVETCSPTKLANLEKHERINFRHLWAVTFALRYEHQRHLSNAGHAIEAQIARRRHQFLDELVVEINAVLEDARSVTVQNEPWELDEIPYLCIVCDHSDVATVAEAAPRVVEAIWRAAHGGGWRPFEWQPFVVEWPRIAIVHLIQGRALQPACATLSTEVILATEATFEVKLHHYTALPVATDVFTDRGFKLWDNPLLRATVALNESITAFVLTNLRFYPLAQLIIENSIAEDPADVALQSFSQELTEHLNAARQSYEELALLLRTVKTPQSEEWETELQRLCTIRLMSVDSDADVTIDIDSFGVWVEQVEETAIEYDGLMMSLLGFSIESHG
jgi:hypothetical protein